MSSHNEDDQRAGSYSPPYSPRSPVHVQHYGAGTETSPDQYCAASLQNSPHNSPSGSVLSGGELQQSPASPVDNGYSVPAPRFLAPVSPPFVPVSPPDYSAMSPLNQGRTGFYSPDAFATHAVSPAEAEDLHSFGYSRGARSSRGFTASNEYAAVRAPSGSPRHVMGPHGPGSALPASGFDRYQQSNYSYLPPVPRSPTGVDESRSANNADDSPMSPYRSSAPNAPVASLPPGSNPPDLPRIPGRSWNNKEKYMSSNLPDRFEQFILADGEKKCVGKPDTRTPNSAIFTFAKEDHTLGNLLKNQLMKDKRVLFSGYKVAHPLIPNFELRIQTDGTITPKEALVECCRGIVVDLDTLSREFTKEFELRKIVAGENQ